MSVVSTPPQTSQEAQVGRSAPRSDAIPKLRGQAQFAGDLGVPGMVHGQVLRSPMAHARIKSIDTSEAESMPGVVAVITGQDLLDLDCYYGHLLRDRPILAIDRVRFAGEPVAAVAAEDPRTAEAALHRIWVEYEELPVVADVEAAIAPDSELVHEAPNRPGLFPPAGGSVEREGNVCHTYRDVRGDTERLFAEADVVVEGTYRFPAVYQYSMETHTVIARHDGEELTVWSSCQHPFLVRAELAAVFGLSQSRVRVIVPYLGGGFGSKSYTKMEPLAGALARAARRPVKLVNRVDESMVTTRRHNMYCRMRTAARADGTVLAREVRASLDTGAYADNGPTVALITGFAAPGPYRWQALDVAVDCVYTNRAPAGSYRGFGNAHMSWIGEAQIDAIARRVGMDRLEIRLRNLLDHGDEVRPGFAPLDADLKGDLQRAAEALGWGRQLGPDEGMGFGVGVGPGGAQPVSNALVRMEADGQVSVIVGTTEIGQGARTVMAQIAADTLGILAEDVIVEGADTRFTPFDRSTGASRSTTLAGLAVQRAAQDLLGRLRSAAADIWAVEPDRVELAQGSLGHAGEQLAYHEVIQRRFGMVGGELVGRGEVGAEVDGPLSQTPAFWEVAVAGAHVAVDRDTGTVRVRRSVTVADVGKAINPQLVERQDEGCSLQAIGNTFFEEMHYSPDGLLLNDTLLDYHVPTFADMPDEMVCVIVENGDGPGPQGAKGCGEGVFGGLPAALVNALAEAGVEVTELPATPERIWRALSGDRT